MRGNKAFILSKINEEIKKYTKYENIWQRLQ